MGKIEKLREQFKLWNRIRYEQDNIEIIDCENFSQEQLEQGIENFKASEKKTQYEPSCWNEIEAQCDFVSYKKEPTNIVERMVGAIIGRFAGCTLGVPVENYPISKMQELAKNGGMEFPPVDYWTIVERPEDIQYGIDKRISYSKDKINGVPVDDDITYVILNMLLLERYGRNYTVEDIGNLWKEILPYACTAEEVALDNLKKGIDANLVAECNPYVEWIGAAIRGDAFGYAYAGDPIMAAKLSYNDAYLSHRRNGIYGEMFTSSAVSAGFVADTPLDALKIAKTCVPKNSRLYKDLEWAFSFEGKLKDYLHARKLLDDRFVGMDGVHTNNNMCAVVFAIMLGEGDYTKTISNSIAIGLDNDCNGATVGSIVGANVSIKNIPEYWYKCFNDNVRTYLIGYENLSLQDVIDRFVNLYNKFLKGE